MIRFIRIISEIKIAELESSHISHRIRDNNGVELVTFYKNEKEKLFSFPICTTLLGEKFALFSYDDDSDVDDLNSIIRNYTCFLKEIYTISPIPDDNARIKNLLRRSRPCKNTTLDTNYDFIEKESIIQFVQNMITGGYVVAASGKPLREFTDKKLASDYYDILKEAINTVIK